MKKLINAVNIILTVFVIQILSTYALDNVGFIWLKNVTRITWNFIIVSHVVLIFLFRFVFNLICIIIQLKKSTLEEVKKAALMGFLLVGLDMIVIFNSIVYVVI